MDDIDELYESLVLHHSKKPKNFGKFECDCDFHSQKGKNPSCGDNLELFLIIENNIITDVKFIGDGCALSVSSTSMMTQKIKNISLDEAKILFTNFINFITIDNELDEKYEPLHIFKNVNKFPLRVKCVLLPWRTLEALINNYEH